MFTMKQPSFKKKVTIDFLQSSYEDHQQFVEELALSEMHALELVMPAFSALASLTKSEFTKFMLMCKRKCSDRRVFVVMVAAIADTLTCMIKNSKFYENYASDNTYCLDMMMQLLCTTQIMVKNFGGFENQHLLNLVGILEKSAKRIQSESVFYERMMKIIADLKTHVQHQADKENRIKAQEDKICNGQAPFNKSVNTELQSELNDIKVFNNLSSNASYFGSNLENTPITQVIDTAVHVMVQQPQISIKKSINAFEILMKSSKSLTARSRSTSKI